MNNKEFSELLQYISSRLVYINQLLFQIIIIILFYYLFEISHTIDNNINNSTNYKIFIYLCAFFMIGLDWFIWYNINNTILLMSVLFIYITYNFNRISLISTFINLTKPDTKNSI
jgi:hypothetical protein